MATFIGTGANESITTTTVSATVIRSPAGSFPGAGADVLLGRGGNDTLDGGGGNDVIEGGDGNDFLRGNTGADVLIGGAGTDTASYTESTAGVTVNLTTGLGSFGSAVGDTLFEIENLNGSNFADILTGNALANTLSGFSGNDTLNGGGGNDTLNGGAGNDTLDGGSGNDTLNGGDGNDFLRGDTGADVLNGGAGTDTASYTESTAGVTVNLTTGLGSFGSAAGDTLFEIENLNGSNFADILTGNALANTLSGFSGNDPLNGGGGNGTLNGGAGNDTLDGDSGNDTLNGGGGNDFLRGDTGADILNGGAGIDTASYTESTAGVNVSLATGLGFFGSAAGDTLSFVENLNGSNFADTLTGDALANTLNGFSGNDTLNGGGGNDTLNGGSGDDVLIGGLGQDDLTGSTGFDRFDFNSVSESLPGLLNRDVITDFDGNGLFAGDRIDVSTIDANVFLIGNQTFSFIGGGAFTAPGQLRYAGGVVQGSTDADLFAEFEIALTGSPLLVASDIIL